MLLCRVEGQVWGAKKADGLEDHRLLVVRPFHADGTPRASTRIVVDRLGAGDGELVLVAHGSRCRDLTLGETVPTKDVTLAIVDGATLGERTLSASDDPTVTPAVGEAAR